MDTVHTAPEQPKFLSNSSFFLSINPPRMDSRPIALVVLTWVLAHQVLNLVKPKHKMSSKNKPRGIYLYLFLHTLVYSYSNITSSLGMSSDWFIELKGGQRLRILMEIKQPTPLKNNEEPVDENWKLLEWHKEDPEEGA